MPNQVSFDLVMDDDMSFVEGTYRLNDSEWRVCIFSKRTGFEGGHVIKPCTWRSGVEGIFVLFPKEAKLNQSTVFQILEEYTGAADWEVVRGPDSIVIR